MTKNCHTPYLRKYTSYDCDFFISPYKFFISSNLIFHVVSGEKRQKMAQNDNSISLCISGTLLHRIVVFDTHM